MSIESEYIDMYAVSQAIRTNTEVINNRSDMRVVDSRSGLSIKNQALREFRYLRILRNKGDRYDLNRYRR